MVLTFVHISFMMLTIIFIIGCGIYSARKIHSAEGFSLNGRHTPAHMVAGAIAGSCIGGGATVGTSQLAFSVGLSAWWFTLGIGIGFIIMALFIAGPLRKSGKETISQILVDSYGSSCGPIASIVSSLGTFFSCVASVLPAIYILARMMDINIYVSSGSLLILITTYIFFGGMKGASISGICKTIILWLMLLIVGWIAVDHLKNVPNFDIVYADPKWFDIFGQGVSHSLENVLSLIVGVISAQTYAQVIFSAKDIRAAKIGAISAALVSIPVGIPCVLVGMYMQSAHPDIPPILALPDFIVSYMPETLAGITLGVVMVSLISSISGLTLGISTMISRDVVGTFFNVANSNKILLANRISIVLVTIAVIAFALYHQNSQVLGWNFLSMSLRGSIFLPLILALFKPKLMSPRWAILSIVVAAFFASFSDKIFDTQIRPLFIAMFTCSIVMFLGIIHKFITKNKNEFKGMNK